MLDIHISKVILTLIQIPICWSSYNQYTFPTLKQISIKCIPYPQLIISRLCQNKFMKNGLATQLKYSKILTIISTLTVLFINHVNEVYQWFGLLPIWGRS